MRGRQRFFTFVDVATDYTKCFPFDSIFDLTKADEMLVLGHGNHVDVIGRDDPRPVRDDPAIREFDGVMFDGQPGAVVKNSFTSVCFPGFHAWII